MKISRDWLQTFFDTPLPDADALADALTFHAFEIDGIEKFGFTKSKFDEVLDVKVTANRGHDCLSYRGIAKEISAILNIPIKNDPLTGRSDLPDSGRSDLPVSVSIDTPLCARYIAGYVKGVKVGPSPEWLVERLAAMGQKSINNIVDATNFVMFNIGQPLHAFDGGKLQTKNNKTNIIIRTARDGEKLLALDEKEYILNPSMLVIVDANADTSIGVAGVKGGMPASITEATHDIIIESANFDGPSVRRTAQALKLRTDASSRFEQGISPELAGYGMREVVDLIIKLAGGEVAGFVDMYPNPQKITPVSVSLTQINRILGTTISADDVSNVFTRLDFAFEKKGDAFLVTPPFERLDLVIPEDLIEEVGRIIGYDKVPAVELPPFVGTVEINPNFYAAEKKREELLSQGYSEVITSVFRDIGERAVANKIDSDKPFLRNNLQPSLALAWGHNSVLRDLLGLKTIKIFEIGTVWKNNNEIVMVGTAEGEKTPNTKRSETSKTNETPLEPVQAHTYDTFPISSATRYQPYSKYPYIVRDIAMWTPASTDTESVMTLIRSQAGELLQRIALFDTFTKADKTSLAFRLVFQSFEKTLTDEEVNQIMQKISATLTAQGFEIR